MRRLVAAVLAQAFIDYLDPRPSHDDPSASASDMRRDASEFLRSQWADTMAAGIGFDVEAAFAKVSAIAHRSARIAMADRLRYLRPGGLAA